MKITDFQAALGVSQLKKLPAFLAKRRQNAAFLAEKLADLAPWFILPQTAAGVEPSWFGFLLSVKEGAPFTKQQLVEYLEQNGVGTRQLFAGNLLRQPLMTDNAYPVRIAGEKLKYSNQLTEHDFALLPNTEFIMNHTFWVGTFPRLGEKELTKTVALLHRFAGALP